MPICEVCGEEEDTVTNCKTCGTKFCEYCGSVEDKKCILCLDNTDEDDDDKDDDMR
ncbi:MAG: hypothetical protein H8E40_06360 [Chloroflexi bacterium]|nr:hypothetical protein [Chloroflexota bacterium]